MRSHFYLLDGTALRLSPPVFSVSEIVITRVFDAPRRLVFEAISKPEHVTRWWGPRSMTMVSCDMDFRPGGAWRFVKRGPDGNDYGFRGVYREIKPPERIVQTFEFEGMPGHVRPKKSGGDAHRTSHIRH